MKKLLLGLAMVFALIGCQEEKMLDIETPELESFYGVIEQGPTKTYIDDLRNVRWQKGDLVAAFLQSTAAKKYQIEDAADGKTSGNFNLIKGNGLSGGTETGLTAAFYPYSSALELTAVADGHYCLDGVVLPAVQEYDPVRTVSQNVLPMLAASNNADNVLNFRNICGVFQFSLKGNAVLDHIVFRGNNGETVCGRAQIEIVPDGIPSISMTGVESQKNLFLVFAEGGLKLDPSKETVFRLALPPMLFEKGFEVLIYDKNGQGMSLKKSSASEIKRSIVLNFPAVDYVPGVIEPSPEIPSPIVPPTPEPSQRNNEIYYTTFDGEVLNVFNRDLSRSRFGAYFLKDKYENGKGVLTFDGDVKYIGDNAFGDMARTSNLQTISIPASVVAIESQAFVSCQYLQHLFIHENIGFVDPSAFEGCVNLEFEVSPGNPDYSSLDGVLFNKDKTALLCYAKDDGKRSYTVPEGVVELGGPVSGYSLETLFLPESLQRIADGALYDSGLSTLIFQSGIPPVLESKNSLPYCPEDGYVIPEDFRIYVPAMSLDAYKTAEIWRALSEYIYVYDPEIGKPHLDVKTKSVTVPDAGASYSIAYKLTDILNNVEITLSTDVSWIKNLVTDYDNISFIVEENIGESARDGLVTVAYPGLDPIQIKVHQVAKAIPSKNVSVNGIDIPLILVKGGTFTMGATPEQGQDATAEEKPAHQVTLSDYFIGQFEVTQRLWEAVMGTNPSHSTGNPDCPVDGVVWSEIVNEFLPRLNGMTNMSFVLPTEAQWEYAARGGNVSQGYKYSGSDNLKDVAIYGGDYFSGHALPVGQKLPNELGVYDMSGNVYEWCRDGYGRYTDKPQIDPVAPENDRKHVVRGGSFSDTPTRCRVSFRLGENDDLAASAHNCGFRLVLLAKN